METTTRATGAPMLRADTLPLRAGPILLASDGRDSTEPALRATRQLAQRFARDVQVLGVVEPLTPLLMPPEALTVPLDEVRTLATQMRQRVSEQLRQDLGERAGWRAEVRQGIPSQTIADTAKERDASLLVTGLSAHPVVDRVFGNEIPVELTKLVDRPLLAVTPPWERLPRTIVITVDMSGTSERVVRFTSALFPDATTIYLVHVMPRTTEVERELPGWEATYERELAAAFDRMREGLPTNAKIETVTLRGSVAKETSDFAQYAKADLIATGLHTHGLFYRLFFGNVATRLLRAATTSVLLVPEGEARVSPLHESRTISLPRHDWPARLRDFSLRNKSRRVTLEIDEPAIGAVVQAYDYPFAGVAYDPRDDRVELMLGEDGTTGRQLTHTIGAPTSIDILTEPRGRDGALRVAYKDGQALTTFMIEKHEPLWTSEDAT